MGGKGDGEAWRKTLKELFILFAFLRHILRGTQTSFRRSGLAIVSSYCGACYDFTSLFFVLMGFRFLLLCNFSSSFLRVRKIALDASMALKERPQISDEFTDEESPIYTLGRSARRWKLNLETFMFR